MEFESETTLTSIQNVDRETEIVLTQRNKENKYPLMILQNTVREIANLNLDVGTVIKTEFPYFEIETTPTSIQNIAKATDKFSPEKPNDGGETDILTLGSALNKSPVMSLLSTENRNSNFEVKEEGDFKTEITDFEIETTPTTIQYVATVTEKLSTEEQLNGLDKNVKRPYNCETCVIGFFSQKNYNEHKLCHMSLDNGPECCICDVTFATEQGFIMHCRITHDELEPKVESITSEEEVEPTTNAVELIDVDTPPEAPNKYNILNLRSHTGDKLYKCNICAKRFTQSGSLKTHEKIHTGDKPYICNICAKRYTLLGNLKRHEISHTGDKPYKCNICAKRYTQSSHLKTHEKIHTGDKPYKCNLCDKSYIYSNMLKLHKRSHTGDKPYKCNICAKRFTQSSHLKTHEKLHTGDKAYKCNICAKRFTQSGHLKTHEKIHTGDKP